MAEKRCGIGFDCASMMQQPSLEVEDCPRNLEGRRGIERRNQFNQIATQLRIAESAIARAWELAAQSPEID